MADQNLYQVRPFMPKQTFDQVSAMMWGQGALDYHTNYIVPRAHWDDSDIREEALYFAGLAQGLRVGASQKPSQPTVQQGNCQDQTSVPVDVTNDQTGSSNSARLAPGKQSSFAVFQAHVVPHAGPSRRPSVATPLQNDPNQKFKNNSPHFVRFDKPEQRASTTAAKGADQEVEEPFGVLLAPNGTTLTIPITDGEAFKVLEHSPKSQPPVAVRKENNIMDALFENIPESSFDENYHDVYTPSTLEEDCDQQAYYEEMERYFGGQGAGSGDIVSDTEAGTYME